MQSFEIGQIAEQHEFFSTKNVKGICAYLSSLCPNEMKDEMAFRKKGF
jgi:hypothetical protein